MGAGRKTQTISAHENVPRSTVSGNGCFSARNLRAEDLCGVIFGCTHETMAECLSKQLFGLPSGHISYVRNIGACLPLFLFNYSDRKLHGIYEAASHGQMNISSSAWTDGGLQRTPFPAQVRFRTRIQCQPLVEIQFRKIIEKNYFTPQHFWFELDHAQTRDLIALFKPSYSVGGPSSMLPSVASGEKEFFQSLSATTSVAFTKKELPQTATWKDVVSGEFQNIKNQNQSHNFVNDNKAALLLSDGGVSECDSPIKTSSNDLEDLESKEPVSDWEDLAVDNVQSTNSDGEAWFGRENHTFEEQKNINDPLECEEKRILHILENLAADQAQLNASSTGCLDDSVCCDPIHMHENTGYVLDELSVLAKKEDDVTAYSLNHGGAEGVKNSYESVRNGNAQGMNLAADHAQMNTSSNGCVDDGACSAPTYMYENTGDVLDEFSVLVKKEDYVAASYLNHEGGEDMKNSYASICSGRAQELKNSYASSCNGSAGIVEYSNASDLNLGNMEFTQFIKELKAWAADVKNHQAESDWEIQQLRNQLWHSDRKIGLLEDRVKELELKCDPSRLVDESLDKFVKQYLGSEDVIYLIGGFDGCSWLSALDSFSPSLDIITPLKSMNSARSYAASVALDGKLFVFGGNNGSSWLDTVEYYNRRHDEWISCPSMLRRKGSLSGATMNGKIFAIGGGDGIECLSDVETFDLETGKWISSKSMLYKRFSSATAELKGAIFAVGGYNGYQYLQNTGLFPSVETSPEQQLNACFCLCSSAESFDPREGLWTQLPSMKTRRGSHALAVFNENIYCIGGFDGQQMVSSVEIFEPRLNSWVMGEPMKFARGYAAAAVLGSSLFAIGGIDDGKDILDTVECYKDGIGWSLSDLKAIGKRCFCSAIVL